MDSYKQCNYGNPPANNTRWAPIQVGDSLSAWGATEGLMEQLISSAGTMKNLYVELAVAPGVGQTITIKLRKNGADTALTVTISGTATTGSDTSNTVAVVAGDRLCWQAAVSVLASGVTQPRISVDYAGDTAKESQLMGGFGVGPTNAAYFPVDGMAQTDPGTFNGGRQVCATAGTIKKLYVNLDAAPGGVQTRTLTVYQNGSATALTVTITGAATTGNDTTHSFTVAAGDTLALRDEESASATNANVNWGMTFLADTDNEFPILAGTTSSPSDSSTSWGVINQINQLTFSITESDRLSIGRASWIKNMYVNVVTAPASGKSWAFTLRDNAANTAISATIANTATTANDSEAAGVAIANFDNLGFQIVPSGTPTATGGTAWGFTATMVEPASPFTPIMFFT